LLTANRTLELLGLDNEAFFNKVAQSLDTKRDTYFKVANKSILSDTATLITPEEFFSDDHLFYEEDGFVGFSDYLTIGDDYAESGWLPYAVAIHFTYKKENSQIWIKHFVSDSNSDTTDVAGKFGEALEKLIEFIDEEGIDTEAADEFRELHTNGHYPGLGSLKKLSIKNHLELLYNLLIAK